MSGNDPGSNKKESMGFQGLGNLQHIPSTSAAPDSSANGTPAPIRSDRPSTPSTTRLHAQPDHQPLLSTTPASAPAKGPGRAIIATLIFVGLIWFAVASIPNRATDVAAADSNVAEAAANAVAETATSATANDPSAQFATDAPPTAASAAADAAADAAAAAADQNTASATPEITMPAPGNDQLLGLPEIRYCLLKKIEINAANGAVNTYISGDVDRFNGMVNDYNSRCGLYRYQAGALEQATAETEPLRQAVEAAGRAEFLPNAASIAPPSDYSTPQIQPQNVFTTPPDATDATEPTETPDDGSDDSSTEEPVTDPSTSGDEPAQ